jgi:dUTP pyrophosphatase
MKVKVKYMPDVERLESTVLGDWIDLHVAKSFSIKAGDFGVLPLGVAMQLPWGYEAIVVPRSSTFKRYGLIMTNSIGVIDESYCGDADFWGFPFYATRDVELIKNTRIAQFRIIKHQPELTFITVDSLRNPSRGGFGSTGV